MKKITFSVIKADVGSIGGHTKPSKKMISKGSKLICDEVRKGLLVFAADKCGPGMYNYPLYSVFCDPMHDGGLILNPKMRKGFVFTIIDMDAAGGGDRIIRLEAPERIR